MGVVKLSTAGIRNYSKTSDFLSGNLPLSLGSFDLLETTTLSTSANSISFTGLGSYATGYKHLQIRYIARSTSANTNNGLSIQLNGDTGSNYTFHRIKGDGSSVSVFGRSSASGSTSAGRITGGNADTGAYGAGVVEILDFGSTQKNKTIKTLGGYANAAAAGYLIEFDSGAWLNTDAITSIEFTAESGSVDFAAGSRFVLIGVK